MKLLKDVVSSPSSFDSLSNYMGEVPESKWLCLLTQNRDSGALDRSNFSCALEQLGGESESVRVDNFWHWACGWWESLSVLEGSEAHKIALGIESALADYPVVDEDHFCELEYTESAEYWQSMSISERVEVCQEHNQSIFSARSESVPDNCSIEEYLRSA